MTTHEFHASHRFPTASSRDADVEYEGVTVPYAGQTRMRLTITPAWSTPRPHRPRTRRT
jgi:hypothetical protein